MKDEILEVIKQTIVNYYWEDKNLIIKAMFTSLIYIEDMCLGDAELILKDLYATGAIEDLDINYQEFKEFMLQDIKQQL